MTGSNRSRPSQAQEAQRAEPKELVHYPRDGNSNCRQQGILIVANHPLFVNVRQMVRAVSAVLDCSVPPSGPHMGVSA
jgi:hypothetical protein